MLFYGIIFSAVVTFLIGFTEDVFRLTPNFPYIANANHSFWIPVFFVSFSFLFAFMGYLSNLQLKDDILSPVRRKLVGYWEVRAQTWKIDRAGGDVAAARTGCAIPRASPHSTARPSQ
jgi:hypothetical protein